MVPIRGCILGVEARASGEQNQGDDCADSL
jgi:hypothetical protein